MLFSTRVTLTLLAIAVGAPLAAVRASAPSGLSLFFESDCPSGWIEQPISQGRMVVSTTNGTMGGFTVNAPLSDQEDRPHSHTTLAATSFPDKQVSALSGSDHTAAAKGSQHGAGTTEPAPSGLAFVQLRLCVTVRELPNVTMPSGAVSFFGPDIFTCPAGFDPLEAANGRVIVPAHDLDITKSIFPPLADQEKRAHDHPRDNGECSISTQPTDFEGVGGCCNDAPAESVTSNPVSVVAGKEDTGLPYVQALTCGAAAGVSPQLEQLPDGAMFFSTSELGCPQGWVVNDEIGGRFPVANPAGGTAGATFGGAPLPKAAQRGVPHSHPINGTIETRPAGIELIHGCCANGYAESGTYSYSCATDDTEPVPFPYIMMPLCRRAPAQVGALRG